MAMTVICKCLRCGGTWMPRVPMPKKCAKCGSPYWAKSLKRADFKDGTHPFSKKHNEGV